MTRETLATWMFLCVPIWSALAVTALAPKDRMSITGAVLVAFAVAGFMAFLVAVISMAARP